MKRAYLDETPVINASFEDEGGFAPTEKTCHTGIILANEEGDIILGMYGVLVRAQGSGNDFETLPYSVDDPEGDGWVLGMRLRREQFQALCDMLKRVRFDADGRPYMNNVPEV